MITFDLRDIENKIIKSKKYLRGLSPDFKKNFFSSAETERVSEQFRSTTSKI